MTLVNKDQLEILASLRESVNEDKAELEVDLRKIKDQLKDANDKNKMQIEQINGLLLEKVNLQGDSIDVREKMLARERDFRYVHNACFYWGSDSDYLSSDLKRVIAGKDLPEDVKSQLVGLHEEVGMLKEQYKDSQDRLNKAKAVCTSLPSVSFLSLIAVPKFIKSQDKLFKEEHAKKGGGVSAVRWYQVLFQNVSPYMFSTGCARGVRS